MMCWSWIDWSRKREALTISCPDRALRPFGGARQGLDKNRENNPMQSKVDPGSQHLAALRPAPALRGLDLTVPARRGGLPSTEAEIRGKAGPENSLSTFEHRQHAST